MKKRIISVALVMLSMFVLLVGCGNNNGKSESASGNSETKSSNGIKVALVVNQKFGDKGPMDDLAKGADKAATDFGATIKKLESASAADFEEDIRAMAKDYDLIVTTFGYMTDATKLIAQEYPDTKFAAIFQNVNDSQTKIDNVWDTEFHGEQAFYINGYIAGKVTKTNVIGLIVGAEEPTPNAEGNAFMQGVKDANPSAKVEFSFVGSYEDPAKAKEIASAMISKNCDIIQTDSGASNAGVVEACKDAGILCSGEITDFYSTYDGFFGVIGIGFGDTVYKAVEMMINDNFVGGEHGIRDLSNGGYFMDWETYDRFANENSAHGEAFKTVLEEAKELEKKITNGELKVEYNAQVPNWSN